MSDQTGIKLIFEDQQLLVLDKPAGWVVNRAQSVKHPTIQDWVAQHYGQLFENISPPPEDLGKWDRVNWQQFVNRHGIVHRLDKETSGVLLVAKTPEMFVKLLEFFRNRQIKKTYRAWVHGWWQEKQGLVQAPVGRLPWNRERFGVLAEGRAALTRYQVLAQVDNQQGQLSFLPAGRFSLLELKPETGRTHQLRVHMKYLHHPIVGDVFYAGRKTARKDRQCSGRMLLHAYQLCLPDGQCFVSQNQLFDQPEDGI